MPTAIFLNEKMNNRFNFKNQIHSHLDGDDNDIMGDKELVNVVWKPNSSVETTMTSTRTGKNGAMPNNVYGFHYEYNDESYEDDDDDDDDDDEDRRGENQTKMDNKSSQLLSNSDPNNVNYNINLLGKIYHPILDYSLRREDESNLFWFSYRCDFSEMKPKGITTDAGWGCMLRAAQMLLAQTMRTHYCGREWKAPKSTVQRRSDPFIQDLTTWFADFPSACTGCWYSIHNMVAAGLTKYDIMPGEWFGPQAACNVIRDLVELHERGWKKMYKKNEDTNVHDGQSQYQRHIQPVLRVYVANDGSIYRNDVEKLMTKDCDRTNQKSSHKTNNVSKNYDDDEDDEYHKVDIDTMLEDPLLHPLSIVEQKVKEEKVPWDTSLLVLVPLRLGLKTFNALSYKIPLAHVMSFPQSVGFVGGAPRHALWFYGCNSDGSKVYGLDPHTVQRAPKRRRLRPDEKKKTGNSKQYQVLLTDEYLRSYNCPNISSYEISKIDPSLAFGFYCRDRADFDYLCSSLDKMKVDIATQDFPPLFSVADVKPDYNADLSSAMMDMMMGGSSSQIIDNDNEINDDDDDFVML